MNEGNVKFLQIKQDAIRKKYERDSVSSYVHMKRDTIRQIYEKRCKFVLIHEAWYPSPPVHICKNFGWLPSISLVTYIPNERPISQPKDK